MSELVIGLLSMGFVLWGVTVYYGQRPPTFAEVAIDLGRRFREVQVMIGSELLPAFRQTAEAFERFNQAVREEPHE